MTSALFTLSFWLAAPVWALLIFAPGRRLTDRVAASALPLVPLLVVYVLLAAAVVGDLWEVFRNPDLAGFQALMEEPAAAGAIWAQLIAWDLFLGQWVYREGRARGFSPWLMGPVLLFTIFFSPFGIALFLLLRAGHDLRRPSRPAPAGPTPTTGGPTTGGPASGSPASGDPTPTAGPAT